MSLEEDIRNAYAKMEKAEVRLIHCTDVYSLDTILGNLVTDLRIIHNKVRDDVTDLEWLCIDLGRK